MVLVGLVHSATNRGMGLDVWPQIPNPGVHVRCLAVLAHLKVVSHKTCVSQAVDVCCCHCIKTLRAGFQGQDKVGK